MFSLVAASSLAAAAIAAPVAPRSSSSSSPQIELGAQETIVFLGDSITQQNLWTAYVETFLTSRFPDKRLLFWNMGVGGNTVEDGLARFDRDVAARKPTIVLVCFGMNDGRYVPPDDGIRARFATGMQSLVDKIKAVGARPILLTPPAVNTHHALYLERYNETLAGLAQAVREVASRSKAPVIDLFTPYRVHAEARPAKAVIIPDGVHPNEAGHLLLAAAALAAFKAPPRLGTLTVEGNKVKGSAHAKVSQVGADKGRVNFTLTPDFLPWHVPAAALATAAGRSLHDALNGFSLAVRKWPGTRTLRLSVDGQEVAMVGPEARLSVDLARLPEAPWAKAAVALWQEAQNRFNRHTLAWRGLHVDASAFLTQLPTTVAARDALTALTEEAGRELRQVAKPRTYKVTLEDTDEVFVEGLEVSPVYPFDLSEADFAKSHLPETAPDEVAWQWLPVKNRLLDLEGPLGHPSKSVAYGRLVVETEQPGDMDMELGSNDGLTVFVNGQNVLARNVSRGLKLGDERLTVPLRQGRNVLLFRVTQHELKHGLALKLRVGGQSVRQVRPAHVATTP